MSQAAIRQELHDLRIMIMEIHAALIQGQQVRPGRYEYDRAIKQFARGNKKPLDDFIKNGGTPPELDSGTIPA
jgi:isocitrate dehydrogenase kinase/phosphatase